VELEDALDFGAEAVQQAKVAADSAIIVTIALASVKSSSSKCLPTAATGTPGCTVSRPLLQLQKVLTSFGDWHAPSDAFIVLASACATAHSWCIAAVAWLHA